MISHYLSSSKKIRKGQSLVEFAFVLPIFLLMIMVITAFTNLFFTQIVLLNAAWEGARAGATITDPSHGDAEIVGAVHNAIYGLDPNRLLIVIDPSQNEGSRKLAFPAPRGMPLQITLKYQIDLMSMGLMITLTSKAVTTMEYQNP